MSDYRPSESVITMLDMLEEAKMRSKKKFGVEFEMFVVHVHVPSSTLRLLTPDQLILKSCHFSPLPFRPPRWIGEMPDGDKDGV